MYLRSWFQGGMPAMIGGVLVGIVLFAPAVAFFLSLGFVFLNRVRGQKIRGGVWVAVVVQAVLLAAFVGPFGPVQDEELILPILMLTFIGGLASISLLLWLSLILRPRPNA